MSMTFSDGSRPTRLISEARSSPRTSSIEKNTSPSASPTSKTRQTAGCVIFRASRTSFRMPHRVLGRRRSNELQGDRRPKHQIVGAPDLAHAAAADARDHPVAAGEHLAGGKSEAASSCPWRPAARCLSAFFMKGQQRLHLLPEARVGSAGFGDECARVRPRERPARAGIHPSRAACNDSIRGDTKEFNHDFCGVLHRMAR